MLSDPDLHDGVRTWVSSINSFPVSLFLKDVLSCDPEEINNTSYIRRSWMTMIIFSLVLLTVVISYLGSNMVLATIRVTQQQADLIEWCTKEMVKITDASMVQALNVCVEYYLKVG